MYTASDLILFGTQLVIPKDKQQCILKAIHEGHLGIEKRKVRIQTCVYWPHINNVVEQYVQICSVCNMYNRANQKEPLLSHSVPMRPWDKVDADYFSFAAQDYFSKYPEVVRVDNKSAEITVEVMKGIFARHGIPTTMISDNVCFNSKYFKEFAKE